MIIKKILLSDFRNFTSKEINLTTGITIILGENAAGKTNILESIYLLATGKSFKARVEEELIRHSSEIARISGTIKSKQILDDGQSSDLEIVFTRGEITIGEDPRRVERAPRKKLLVNGVAKRLVDFAGNLKIVLFGPWDMDLVTESPSVRRNFLDSVLSQTDREYRRALLSYEKGLRQRNKLLFRIREEGIPRSQLLFWNTLLIKNGEYLTQKREEFIEFVNSTKSLHSTVYTLTYDKSIISENRLEQYKNEEIGAATTLVGPHRDDFVFRINTEKDRQRDLARFGSRGEQRMGVLWVKLAELSYIEEIVKEKPLLLLDDIFSELDHLHREMVFDIAKHQQTIITTADPHFVENLKESIIIKI